MRLTSVRAGASSLELVNPVAAAGIPYASWEGWAQPALAEAGQHAHQSLAEEQRPNKRSSIPRSRVRVGHIAAQVGILWVA